MIKDIEDSDLNQNISVSYDLNKQQNYNIYVCAHSINDNNNLHHT